LVDVKVVERENAIFECCVSHKKIPVTWYVSGTEVVPGPKYQVLAEEFTHRLAINVTRPADEGEVKAVFRDETSTAKLAVEREYKSPGIVFTDVCLSASLGKKVQNLAYWSSRSSVT